MNPRNCLVTLSGEPLPPDFGARVQTVTPGRSEGNGFPALLQEVIISPVWSRVTPTRALGSGLDLRGLVVWRNPPKKVEILNHL